MRDHTKMTKNKKLLLQNHDFVQNHVQFYKEIRSEKDTSDVTLAIGDQTLDAHKMILSAASSLFRNIIRKSKTSHSFIYLNGVNFEDMEALLDFIYTGQAKVPANTFKRFLATADELKVGGLMAEKDDKKKQQDTKQRKKEKNNKFDDETFNNDFQEPNSEMENSENGYMNESNETQENIYEEAELSEADITENLVEEQNIDDNTFIEMDMINESKEEKQENDDAKDIGEANEIMDPIKSEAAPKKRNKKNSLSLKEKEEMNQQIEKKLIQVFDRKLQKPVFKCLECETELNMKKPAAKAHVQGHLLNYKHKCDVCGIKKKSEKALADHMYIVHYNS